jgi:UDP-N-acetylglucosamine 2-epimerase (non-hydrolysing)
MKKFEKICISYKPEFVIVVGDVTSTVAAALVVCKMPGIKLVHVEAGGRSFDKTMPEEINRIITDAVSDYLFAIEPGHVQNLLNEGIDKDKIFLVGDNLIDNLLYTTNKISRVVSSEKYILVTVHRQNNTDDISRLKNILTSLDSLARDFKIKFPIHPRTDKKIKENGLEHLLKHIVVLPPLGYTNFVTEMKSAAVVLTDSGGITIEAAVLGVPCVVLRKELERNFLVEEGLSVLVDNDVAKILKETRAAIIKGSVSLNSKWSNLIDGKASSRMIKILLGD